MVIDKIENILFYKPMIPALEAGIAAVKAIEKLEPGKYRFDGGYFNIQKGETKPMNEGTFEAHRRYIDVQILAKGCEEVAWADVGDQDRDPIRQGKGCGTFVRGYKEPYTCGPGDVLYRISP